MKNKEPVISEKNHTTYIEAIEIDLSSATNEEWKTIVSEKLKSAGRFEIHCWNEEEKEIEMALRYGRLKETGWS